jgi:hypothetical protein
VAKIVRLPPERADGAGLGDQPVSETVHFTRLRGLAVAFYFSLLSAFQVGWKDLNFGSWLSRMQPKPYRLVATGWGRTLSGLQSLLSVFLLAQWALTYFGRPFE